MATEASSISLPSGCAVERPVERLLRFCREEYAYYDAIPDGTPNRIAPLDVLVTVAVNAFYSANAAVIRRIHRGLSAQCDPLLHQIPTDADLSTFDPSLTVVEQLLHAAIQPAGVLIPVATKVLHRKRPALIPILDNVVLGHYLGTTPQRLPARTQEKRSAARAAVEVLALFRNDLAVTRPAIEAIQQTLAAEGYFLSAVRILELLVWTQVEERGYYR